MTYTAYLLAISLYLFSFTAKAQNKCDFVCSVLYQVKLSLGSSNLYLGTDSCTTNLDRLLYDEEKVKYPFKFDSIAYVPSNLLGLNCDCFTADTTSEHRYRQIVREYQYTFSTPQGYLLDSISNTILFTVDPITLVESGQEKLDSLMAMPGYQQYTKEYELQTPHLIDLTDIQLVNEEYCFVTAAVSEPKFSHPHMFCFVYKKQKGTNSWTLLDLHHRSPCT